MWGLEKHVCFCSTDLGMIGLHGTLTRVFPEKQLGDEVGKTQQLPSSCLSWLQVAHLWLVFLIHHVMGYGQGAGWVRAPFSAGCDTTIWISVPVNLHKKAVSSQRYEFRIFSSVSRRVYSLPTLTFGENWIWGPWRTSFPCGEQFLFQFTTGLFVNQLQLKTHKYINCWDIA